MGKILKYVMLDIAKNKLVIIYAFVLSLLSWSIFNLEDNSTKGLLSLTNVVLLIVPLVSVIFANIYMYNSSEFIELLLSQPLQRHHIWLGFFLGISLSLSLAFFVGVGIPLIIYTDWEMSWVLNLVGFFNTFIFAALAMFVSVFARDKARGIGLSILVWLFFSVLFDGLLLLLIFQFSAYPIEKTMIVLTSFNPIDLSRILILLKLDVSALMGFTGALFKEFFGSQSGQLFAFVLLMLWILLPYYFSQKSFKKKDL